MTSLPPDDLDRPTRARHRPTSTARPRPRKWPGSKGIAGLLARVDELRAIASRVAGPPAVDGEARERIVAAAARELGVASLAEARQRRRAAPVLSAAAAVLLLLLVGTAIALRNDRDDVHPGRPRGDRG